MAKEKEVNIIVDAKNKAKGAFLEVKKGLQDLGNESKKGLDKFTNSFANADKVIFSFADKMQWMDKIAKRTFQGTAAAASVYMVSTLRDFSQLNDGISRVNTLYDQTRESQRKMYQDSTKMFSLLPTDFNKITQGIYDTISAGADPKHATMYARKFGMAGVAGDADMDVVTKAAMGTMNAYKLEAKDLNRVLDLQFMTVKDGITSYSELASSLGTGVLAGAKSAGITMEELYGSIAMITKNAIPANIATTSLNQMFNKFTDTKVIKRMDQFGVKLQDGLKHTRPLVEILKDLNYQFDKRNMTSEQRKGFFKELLGSDEAARAILPLISDLKEFQKIMNDMDNSTGAMKDAFNDRLESMNTQFKLFWNQIKSIGLEQILTLEPLLNAVMEPWIKRTKLELEIADLEDAMLTEKNPLKKEMMEEYITELKLNLENIDLTPTEKFRAALEESVKALDKINPPLAKFLDTIGNFALNFVGKEGTENREKAGNVVETVLRIYGAKKLVDIVNWFSKNFKQPTNPSKGGSEAFNGTGGNGANNASNNSSPINPETSMFNLFPKSFTDGVYIPKKYYVSGEKYNEFENTLKKLIEDKSNNMNSPRDIYIYPVREFNQSHFNPIKPKSKEETKEVLKLMETGVINELLKINQLQDKINNTVNMQSQITIEPPKIDINTRVYIDGKNIPSQKVEVDYGKIERHFDNQAKRHGRV